MISNRAGKVPRSRLRSLYKSHSGACAWSLGKVARRAGGGVGE